MKFIMKKFLIPLVLVASSLFSLDNNIVLAQSCNAFIGTTLGGNDINLDRCSISRSSSENVYFSYSVKTLTVGNKKLSAQANCSNNTWSIFPENKFDKPNNPIALKILKLVCDPKEISPRKVISTVNQNVVVVKTSPSDPATVCVAVNVKSINIYRLVNSWYYTDVCGRIGVVHRSQLGL